MPENSTFFSRLQDLLGQEFTEFEKLSKNPPFYGLRVNTLKCDKATVEQALSAELSPAPFSPYGYYIQNGRQSLGNHPLHHAGAFYMQEPSAQSAVTALDPQEGDHVLDLCAAPGGKSTQIAQYIGQNGLLWANEKVFSRCKILVSNLERMGIGNAVVSSLDVHTLCNALPEYFDKVLVDAPCSGEGMFRQDETILKEWNLKNILACAERQKEILAAAAKAVRPGGVLVYSTCTYAPEENEETLRWFLQNHPAFVLEKIEAKFGRSAFGADIANARRILPMDGGEGHFVARLRRNGNQERLPFISQKVEIIPLFNDFWSKTFDGQPPYTPVLKGDSVYLVPDMPPIGKLPTVRNGLFAGTLQKGRFVPEHALFAAAGLHPKQIINFTPDSLEIARFLHGEEIDCPEHLQGYVAVQVAGAALGFGKAANGRLKNHYPKGLRTLK